MFSLSRSPLPHLFWPSSLLRVLPLIRASLPVTQPPHAARSAAARRPAARPSPEPPSVASALPWPDVFFLLPFLRRSQQLTKPAGQPCSAQSRVSPPCHRRPPLAPPLSPRSLSLPWFLSYFVSPAHHHHISVTLPQLPVRRPSVPAVGRRTPAELPAAPPLLLLFRREYLAAPSPFRPRQPLFQPPVQAAVRPSCCFGDDAAAATSSPACRRRLAPSSSPIAASLACTSSCLAGCHCHCFSGFPLAALALFSC
ncbi:hypothetical protein NL676_008610 [Syzygium grande]|nr:hypothetical protein NL676_008610 [Syzygium grande]